ncbi:hypothetical protein LTR84_010584 [Exophiala bonariae]|uniref:Protein kinase domain-containing protein n=1 Tax=Exophiala bonariae TaxID=1690606 RepID=A0AAV9MSY5_9EURO|nr:hypothetical protein LTR84_010584 [Exophiala bonariae]
MSSDLDRNLRIPLKDQNRDSKLHLESIWGDLRSRTTERTNSPDEAGKDAQQSLAMEDTSALRNYVKEYTPFAKPRHGQNQKINRIKHESPWKAYKSGYDLKLDQFVTVAVRKAPGAGKVAIREFDRQDGDRKIEMLWSVRHERFVNLLEIFEVGDTYYAVFEHIFVTLVQVVNCPAYPTERQLAAIIGQVN